MPNPVVAEPKTLQEAILYFSDLDNSLAYMVARRWPNGVACPVCGRTDATFLKNQRKWQCRSHHATRQFSAKTGTIFEDSPLGLDKWLTAVWMITNCKNGVSSYEIHRALGVTQKTAWFMLQRIRLAMQTESYIRKLSGHVEVYETFIGGKARNMHKHKREKALGKAGTTGKVIVIGTLQRNSDKSPSQVRAAVIEERDVDNLHGMVEKHVRRGSKLSSDEHPAYSGLEYDYDHDVINHAEAYVRGQVHTNGMENFWSLLKRGLHGTYISVEPFHLHRYISEQVFRFNNRATKKHEVNDADRFRIVVSQVAGKRVTYQELTGKVGKPHPDTDIPF